jgi:acetyl-CoA/propionyl-CoA carboxylase biotin carboxyl carrier protein
MVVDGMATVLPFHRLVVRDPDFTDEPFRVHTRWIETQWSGGVEPYAAPSPAAGPDAGGRTSVVVEVAGRRLEVTLPVDLFGGTRTGPAVAGGSGAVGGRPGAAGGPPGAVAGPYRRGSRGGGQSGHAPAATGEALTSPMQGTIVKLAVADGDTVAEGDLVVVLEAMKMEQPLYAHRPGVVHDLTAAIGATVSPTTVICHIR